MKKILIALMMMSLSTGAIAGEVSNAELLEEIIELKKEVAELKDDEYVPSTCDMKCHKMQMALLDQMTIDQNLQYKKYKAQKLCDKQWSMTNGNDFQTNKKGWNKCYNEWNKN